MKTKFSQIGTQNKDSVIYYIFRIKQLHILVRKLIITYFVQIYKNKRCNYQLVNVSSHGDIYNRTLIDSNIINPRDLKKVTQKALAHNLFKCHSLSGS